jgi:predicted DNA binding CopG/RHH family protein
MPASKQQKAKVHRAAREQLLKDASIHVRLTRELMESLLDAADAQNIPVSMLVRRWIEDKLTGSKDLKARVHKLEKQLQDLKKRA